MTLKTEAYRCFIPYKTAFLSGRSLILPPLTRGSNLVSTGYHTKRLCSKVMANPLKSSIFFTDTATTAGLTITPNPILPITIGGSGFLSVVYHLLLSLVLYIGFFLNHMDLKSAMCSRTLVRYLAYNHLFHSRQVIFIPVAVSLQPQYTEEQELMSWNGSYPFDPSLSGSVPVNLVRGLQCWMRELFDYRSKYCLISSL